MAGKICNMGGEFYCLVSQLCPTLCNSMDCRMPGFPVLQHLPEFAQTHVHWVGDAIQPSLPLSSPSAFNPSQHQGLFQWVRLFASGGQRIGASVSVLPMNIQDWFLLGFTGLISLQSKELSRVFSSTTVWRLWFFGCLPSLWSSSHNPMWPLDYMDLCPQSDVFDF